MDLERLDAGEYSQEKGVSSAPAEFSNMGVSDDQDILGLLKRDFDRGCFSWIGDYKDFILGYITFASSLHAWSDTIARPVGSFVVGSSSSGKTQFLECIKDLFPDEMVVNLTTASPKSLIYHCKDDPYFLRGKIVFVEEMSGLQDEDIQYLLRTLVTKGQAKHTTVQGGAVQIINIIGGISLQSTGLNCDVLRDDTMNRMVLFNSDDSDQMTSKVVDNIKNRYLKSPKTDSGGTLPNYKILFRNLTPYRVIIPFANRIKIQISSTENRRLTKIFMDLLATVTLLNQKSRTVDEQEKTVLADERDFYFLFDLISKKSSSPSETRLSVCEQVVYRAACRLSEGGVFTYADVKESRPGYVLGKFNGYGATSIKNSLKNLTEIGLLKFTTSGKKKFYYLSRKEDVNPWGVIGLD